MQSCATFRPIASPSALSFHSQTVIFRLDVKSLTDCLAAMRVPTEIRASQTLALSGRLGVVLRIWGENVADARHDLGGWAAHCIVHATTRLQWRFRLSHNGTFRTQTTEATWQELLEHAHFQSCLKLAA